MPPPTPDPVSTSLLSSAGHLGWADFATIIGVVIALLTFLGTLLLKNKGKDTTEGVPHSTEELDQLKAKIKQLQSLAESLDENYTELKKEIRSLEDSLEDFDRTKSKDIRKLESEIEDLKRRMDKIIDLILKLLSDQQ